MKKLSILVLALTLLLGACGDGDYATTTNAAGDEDPLNSASSSAQPGSGGSGLEEGSVSSTAAVWEAVKIMDISDSGAATVLTRNGSLLTFALPDKINMDPDLFGDELKPGMTAHIGYDGVVLETYPGQIQVDSLSVDAYDDGVLSMFFEILEDLYNTWDWMNQDIKYLGIDLTRVHSLSQEEQQAVAWLFATRHGVEPVCGSFYEIVEQGFFNTESTAWEDGALLRVEMLETLEDSFTVQCGKWKEGDTYSIYGVKAKKENGLWNAEADGSEGTASFIRIYPDAKLTADDFPGLYRQVLSALIGNYVDLDEDVKYYGFDKGNVDHLTQEEWEELGQALAKAYGKEAVFGTVSELEEQGYFDLENDGAWQDGILFQLKITGGDEDRFTLDCNKWRGLMAAHGFELAASQADGGWVVQRTGAEHVS